MQSQGSYWYLDTRVEEFNNMKGGRLKLAAKALDLRLKGDHKSNRHMTIIHGDPKAANFNFSNGKEKKCVMYDF